MFMFLAGGIAVPRLRTKPISSCDSAPTSDLSLCGVPHQEHMQLGSVSVMIVF